MRRRGCFLVSCKGNQNTAAVVSEHVDINNVNLENYTVTVGFIVPASHSASKHSSGSSL